MLVVAAAVRQGMAAAAAQRAVQEEAAQALLPQIQVVVMEARQLQVKVMLVAQERLIWAFLPLALVEAALALSAETAHLV